MNRSWIRWIAGGLGIALVAGLVTLAITDGDDGASTTAPSSEQPLGSSGDQVGAPGGADAEREVKRVVKRYVTALNRDDGARVCDLLIPGAVDDVELPRERGDCAGSLTASIGYRDPRGLPVFKDSRITRIPGVEVSADEARVTATIVTRFADRNEPSIEDDIVYLSRDGDEWLIVKPTAAIYRAIGAEPPPQAITPP
jgi:hypothetical protein